MQNPKSYSFNDINDFVHEQGRMFEELQCACLGMAIALEQAGAGLEVRSCTWTLTEPFDDEIWETICGESWSFVEGRPEDNNVRFCQGCGRTVVTVVPEIEDDGDDEPAKTNA